MNISGIISSDSIYELRFPLAGKVSVMNVRSGDHVTKGTLLARLDQTELQLLLDRSLKLYESVRTEFESQQASDLDKYERQELQLRLDISVKNVEIAKANLEATNLISPVTGTLLTVDPVTSGMNITPAAFTISLLADNSLYFQAFLSEVDLISLKVGDDVSVALTVNPSRQIPGKVIKVGFMADKAGRFPVFINLSDQTDLRLGLTGTVVLSSQHD